MEKQVRAQSATIHIKASPKTIWKIITDASSYPAWDPWAIRIEGTIAPGETVTTYTKLNPSQALPARVTEFVPGQKMVWTGAMPFGLFTGVRTFSLHARADGSVDFTVDEQFAGPLLPLFAKSLPDMTRPFRDFVAGLKARAEGQ